MKKLITLIVLSLILTTTGFAQNQDTKKADQFYNTYQYTEAIKAYSKLAEKNRGDSYVYKQLGNSYYKIFNTKKAAKWYAKAIASKKQDAETYYRYAQTLKSQGKYEEANAQLDIFAKLKPNDQRAKAHLKNPNYIPKLTTDNDAFTVKKLKISERRYSDFSPILTNGNILYFVSTRNPSNKKDERDQPYLDIYKSKRSPKGKFSKPEAIKALNTRFHDGPITISSDGKTAFFARDGHSGYYKKTKDGKVKVAQQVLYRAQKVNGKWENITSLPLNSSKYSITHPSLSQDGKTLYFASDMPGGLGDTDIWKVSVNGNRYGKPENLGPNVNTAAKEGFPFISENHILYFSSNGKQGLGGLDVFKIDLSKNENAKNIGAPVNTNSDDFSFSYNKTQDIAFFASNRDGSDNLYQATPECHVKAIAVVTDKKTSKALSGAEVAITDTKGNIIATEQTDNSGKVSFNVQCNTSYEFQISKNNYESDNFPVKKTKKDEVQINASLSPVEVVITDKEVKLENIYFEFDKSNITKSGATELNKLVKVMNDHPEMKIFVKAHTDSKGNSAYNEKLSERRAQATIQYLISQGINKDRLSGKGVGSADPKIDCRPNCSDEQRAENRRSEFLIEK